MASTNSRARSNSKITRKGKGRLATLAKSKNVQTVARLVGYGSALGLLGGCALGAGTAAYRVIAG